MKIKISYEYDPKYSNKFWARSGTFLRSGESWNEARENLIYTICLSHKRIEIPPDEETEIDI